MLAPVRSQSKPSTEAFTAKNFITDNQYLSILQGIITINKEIFFLLAFKRVWALSL